MEISHAHQEVNSAKGSVVRHPVTSSDSSLDIKPEKTLVEKTVTSSPPGAQRRGLWRRIWGLFSGSKENTSTRPKGSPPTIQEWLKPEKYSTVQKDYVPAPHRFRYRITRSYCPVDNVTRASIKSAPWYIHTNFYSHTATGAVCTPPRWPEDLHQCWWDKISVREHPMVNKSFYARDVNIIHLCTDGSYDWMASISIWHYDSEWLNSLTYADMKNMLLRRSLIKSVTPHPPPLEQTKYSVS